MDPDTFIVHPPTSAAALLRRYELFCDLSRVVRTPAALGILDARCELAIQYYCRAVRREADDT